MVNNAGIETLGFAWELSSETWDRALGVNINGVVHGVRAFAPRMIAAGRPAFIAMEDMLAANGISSEQAAERILPQIAAGDFWVSTDKEMTRQYAAARAQTLLDLQPPALAPELAASLLKV